MFEDERFYDEAYASRTSPMLRKVLEILSDGEWHLREEVVSQVVHMIPPGPAWRFSMRTREHQVTRRARMKKTPEEFAEWSKNPDRFARSKFRSVTEDELIRQGRRGKVSAALGSSERIQTTYRDGVAYIRRISVSAKYLNSLANQMRNKEK